MKLKKNTVRKNAIWTALLLGSVFILISVALGLQWETNDDPAIAMLLSRDTNDYSPFQWRILSVALHFLYIQMPIINWWAVCSVFAVWASALVCVYVIYRRYTKGISFFVSCITLVLLWFVTLHRMNFTRTAVAVAMAGCILVADSIFVMKIERADKIQFFLGCLLLLFGASIRRPSAMIALAFLALIGAIRLLSDHFVCNVSWIKAHKSQILMLCLTAVVFFAGWMTHNLVLTPEQKQFKEYNNLRASIQDYSGRYPKYEEASEIYEAMGLEKIDWQMLFGWFSEDTEVFSVETLKAVAELGVEEPSIEPFVKMLGQHKLITGIIFVLIFMLSFWKKQNWLRNGIVIGAMLFMLIYLALSGRLPFRVYQSILWVGTCAVLFLSGSDYVLSNRERRKALRHVCMSDMNVSMKIKNVFTFGLFIGCLVLIGLGCWRGKNLLALDSAKDTVLERETKRVFNREVYDLIDADTESIYIFDLYYAPAAMSSTFSFWEARPTDYVTNKFLLGGWDCRHPYNLQLLEEYGITNPVRALFERTDVKSTYSSRLLNYMHSNYDQNITVSEIGALNGVPLVQYTAPIEDAVIESNDQNLARVSEFYYFGSTSIDTWYISANVSVSDDEARVFYCNITSNGDRVTYRLKYDGNGGVSAFLYGLDSEFDADNANIVIFEQKEDESYVKYKMAQD